MCDGVCGHTWQDIHLVSGSKCKKKKIKKEEERKIHYQYTHFHFGFPDNFSVSIFNKICCGMEQNLHSYDRSVCCVIGAGIQFCVCNLS